MKYLAYLAVVACWLCLPAFRLFALVDQPIVESIEVTTSYALAGDPTAQYNLGIRYGRGEGVARDPKQSLEWYRRAAQAGFAPAQYNLGVLYANGENVARDDKEAAKWLHAAAQQGVFEAQTILIEFYLAGRGVEKSQVRALTWDFLARRSIELLHEQPAGEPPHPAKLRTDGAAEVVRSIGKREAVLPDGGVETTNDDGSRHIIYADGRRTRAEKDGTKVTTFPNGLVETLRPDGTKSARDPKGFVKTTHPDGTVSNEGDGTDQLGRKVRITETLDQSGKRAGRRVVREDVTIIEDAERPISRETVLTDTRGVKVKLTEAITRSGEVGKRMLTQLETGKGPEGAEIWTIKRTIETSENLEVDVTEGYSSEGFYNQEVTARRNVARRSLVAPASPVIGGETRMIPAQVPSAAESMPPEIRALMAAGSRERGGVLKPRADIAPMLAKLEELEGKGRNFAGATEQDWKQAKAAAAAFYLPLANPPQKAGASAAWLTAQQLSQSSLPEVPLLAKPDDGSKASAFGFHGRELIKQLAWKHADTAHFIVHFIQESDARLTMQFIEGVHTMVTRLLNLDPQRIRRKGHVFLFPDQTAWRDYLAKSGQAGMLAGFAYKDELLLPVAVEGGLKDEAIKTLCHEATHAVFGSYYPGRRPPLWMNEGFAEYLAARTIAAKRGNSPAKYLSTKSDRPMAVDEVFRRIRYSAPSPDMPPGVVMLRGRDPDRIEAFYANAEKCVRVLIEKLPPDGLPIFVNDLIAGNNPDAAFAHAYGKKCPDAKAFAALVDAN